jgi:hypothetical protein
MWYFLYKNEYRIFKPVETTIRKGLGRKKKNQTVEPNWTAINIWVSFTK